MPMCFPFIFRVFLECFIHSQILLRCLKTWICIKRTDELRSNDVFCLLGWGPVTCLLWLPQPLTAHRPVELRQPSCISSTRAVCFCSFPSGSDRDSWGGECCLFSVFAGKLFFSLKSFKESHCFVETADTCPSTTCHQVPSDQCQRSQDTDRCVGCSGDSGPGHASMRCG